MMYDCLSEGGGQGRVAGEAAPRNGGQKAQNMTRRAATKWQGARVGLEALGTTFETRDVDKWKGAGGAVSQ